MLKNINVRKFKTWARKNQDLALTVVKAQAFYQLERERVDAYIAPVFAGFGFKDEDGDPIPSASKLYLCEDDDACAAFYAACDVAHRANGWTGEAGHCPALTAESLMIQAENLLLDSLAALMGVSFSGSLELRAKALKLALGACTLGIKSELARKSA